MASQETQQLDAILASRRAMLMGGSALAGLAFTAFSGGKAYAQQAKIADVDILNFALNLEFLEATYYTLATTGALPTTYSTGAGGAGTSGKVTVKGNNNYSSCKVPFSSPSVNAIALELAFQERNHVTALQNLLVTGSVAQPDIDLFNSFVTLGNQIGVSNFDPFANDANFLLGAYIFEDLGVSAYHGAAGLLGDKQYVLPAAVQIHAAEAYHGGLIRTTLFQLDPTNAKGYLGLTQKISSARATLDGTASKTADDVGITVGTVALEGAAAYPAVTIANADANSQGWARTTAQVLSVVYAGGSGKGGFFPNGLNGTYK